MFYALIYKSWCISKRKYFSTVLSISWPNLILLAVIFIKNSQNNGSTLSYHQTEIIPEQYGKDHFLKIINDFRIAYTPVNEFTKRIMSNVNINKKGR